MRYFLALSIGLFSATLSASSFSVGPLAAIYGADLTIAPCKAAPAKAYLKLCKRFTTGDGLADCIAAGKNKYYDQCALNLCNRFTTENGAIGCLQAAANQKYDTDEMALCKRNATEAGAIRCLQAAGSSIKRKSVKRLIRKAISHLDNNEVSDAKRALKRALNRL